jgi:hypothetical protein
VSKDPRTPKDFKFPLAGDWLTNLVMQRLRDNLLTLQPMAPAIAQFCGVRIEPVCTWLIDPKAKPLGGIVTLKLWYFQRQLGLACPELDAVMDANPYGAAVGKLLAYDVIKMEQARELCGAKEGAVLSGARGGQTMTPKLNLAKLQAQYGSDLQAAIELLNEQIAQHRPTRSRATTPQAAVITTREVPAPPAIDPPQPETSSDDRLTGLSSNELVELFIKRLGLTPEIVDAKIADIAARIKPQASKSQLPVRHELIRGIADTLMKAHADATYALEALTPEELAFLKRLVGEDLPFNLKNALAALCGSRAHQISQGG